MTDAAQGGDDSRGSVQRAFLWTPVAFGAGIALYFHLPFEPEMIEALAALGASLGLYLRFRSQSVGIGLGFAGLVCAALGFTVAKLRTEMVEAPILAKRSGPVTVGGPVRLADPVPGGLRITIEKPRISGLEAFETPQAVRLRLQGRQPNIEIGDWIRVRAILSPPSAPAAPGAFDFQRQAFFKKLGGVGFSIGEAKIVRPAAAMDSWRFMDVVGRLRQDIGARVRTVLPGDIGTVSAALMTGEKRAIGKDTLTAMRDSGLAHLLAISGLHLGLVAGGVFFALRFVLALSPNLALTRPIKKWAAGAGLLTAVFYCLMAGATVPTVRAAFMAGLVFVAVMLDRRAITLRLVAFAALVGLFFQPESLLSAGFQMSFAAVTALVAVYEAASRARSSAVAGGKARPGSILQPFVYLASVSLTTLVASAATGFFAVYHFNRFAEYSLLANLLAVPVTALWIMPWAVVSYIAMPFGLENPPLTLVGAGVSLVRQVAVWVAGLPGAARPVAAMPDISMPLFVVGGLMLCLTTGGKRLLGLVVVLTGVLIIPTARPPDILIGERGGLAAVRDAKGRLVFVNPKGGSFVKGVWLRRVGQAETRRIRPFNRIETDWTWPAARVSESLVDTGGQPRLRCDAQSCIYRIRGKIVALTKAPEALPEDCRRADLVIGEEPIRGICGQGTRTIDRCDLWRYGAHAIWVERNGSFTIRTVNGERGNRPWVPKKDCMIAFGTAHPPPNNNGLEQQPEKGGHRGLDALKN